MSSRGRGKSGNERQAGCLRRWEEEASSRSKAMSGTPSLHSGSSGERGVVCPPQPSWRQAPGSPRWGARQLRGTRLRPVRHYGGAACIRQGDGEAWLLLIWDQKTQPSRFVWLVP
uniref:Uncharacterized protein n=1 Tax=Oryza punctata TaxID=4537 RepID=A0A0E0LYD8_ORYPU